MRSRFAERMAWSAVLLCTGCSHHSMTVPANYVVANPTFFKSDSLGRMVARLVVSQEFQGYVYEKKAYSALGGWFFPDTLTFDLGRTLTAELDEMMGRLFQESGRRESLLEAIDGLADFIVVPEILEVNLDLPTLRWTDVESRIVLKYRVYDGAGSPLGEHVITGNGKKKLTFTKENYVISLQDALKDLLLQTKDWLNTALVDHASPDNAPGTP